jgi:diacylglycerol kinase family enzyme
MITKEIWKKKQLIKIAYTNKSFSKSLIMAKNTKNQTIDAGAYGYGKGICYTEEMDPKDDFMFEAKKPGLNGSFNGSSRGVSITPALFKRSIHEEANEIERLKVDVYNIEEKIDMEMNFFETLSLKYREAKGLYEDKNGTVDDLMEFHR